MAQISITIPDSVLNRVVDAICAQHDYQATINGAPNPETKSQFARRMIREFVKGCVRRQEMADAQAAALVKADGEISIT